LPGGAFRLDAANAAMKAALLTNYVIITSNVVAAQVPVRA
jgi:hypothetical protein